MKPGIHPQYNTEITATCACGGTFLVGSTDKEIKVEICSNCHPFFTGKQKLVDTAGRVDKFRARLAAKEQADTAKKEKETAKAKTKEPKKVEKTEKTEQ